MDDHEPARYAKRRILTAANFTVFDAGTAQEALNLVAEHSPDLVLLDVHLPDINGIEVCRRLKSSAASASILVLQISASATSAPQATAALNSGADAYLIEPVDPDVLIATVRALLRLRTAERQLAESNQRLEYVNTELRRSNEDLQQFAFAASHDLQEPLRTITSFLQLLQLSLRERMTDTEREYFEFVVDGSARMRQLIGDLLAYSQVGRNATPASLVDLSQVLQWTQENLRKPIAESAAKVTSGVLPQVLGDFALLGHVFQNLISNSIKYRRPESAPEIHLTAARASEQEWQVSVRDNGIGIEEQYHEIIFAPFKRLHGREIAGTGIGLATCRRIIQSMGGRIWVESLPGEGSAFHFTLPVA
ncbi:MAG TPA: ATP-binding protein [Bryobacteraceae bacterium]|nr:ATP-binding protein [Bryobacteraceae bacterium]